MFCKRTYLKNSVDTTTKAVGCCRLNVGDGVILGTCDVFRNPEGKDVDSSSINQ
jgi:hypothetical protein